MLSIIPDGGELTIATGALQELLEEGNIVLPEIHQTITLNNLDLVSGCESVGTV